MEEVEADDGHPRMTSLERALERMETGHGEPLNWHVLWVIPTGTESHGLYTERKQMLDLVELGHATRTSAENHVRQHPYHHRFQAWLFNAKTGKVVSVAVCDRTRHTP
jgi:hypothetical protein